MTDREKLYSGISNAAWGYFFLTFNFNLGTLNVLPNFVGWFLFRSAIEKLEAERRELKLLLPLCTIMTLWYLTDWLLTIFGVGLSGRLLIVNLLQTVVALYFHFQFLTDLAALADAHLVENGRGNALRDCRTAYVVILTVGNLLLTLPLDRIVGDWWGMVNILLAVVGCLVALFIMFSLFSLRKCFQEGNWEQEEKNS